MTDVDVRVVASSSHWGDFSLWVDSCAVGVSHAVDQEMHVSGRGLCNLETVVWRIQRSDHSAHVGALDITNPQSDTTWDLLVGAIDVDDTSLAARNPGDFVDLAGVQARLGDLAGLEVDQVHARACAAMLLKGVLGVREQSDGAIGTWVGGATADVAEESSISLVS